MKYVEFGEAFQGQFFPHHISKASPQHAIVLLPSAGIRGLENVGAGIYMLQSWFSPFVFIFSSFF